MAGVIAECSGYRVKCGQWWRYESHGNRWMVKHDARYKIWVAYMVTHLVYFLHNKLGTCARMTGCWLLFTTIMNNSLKAYYFRKQNGNLHFRHWCMQSWSMNYKLGRVQMGTDLWQCLDGATPLGDKGTGTITQNPIPYTEPTSPCPIIITLSAWLGSDKYQR